MAVMDDFDLIAERYRTFADLEARGSSPSYEAWSRAVAGDQDLLVLNPFRGIAILTPREYVERS